MGRKLRFIGTALAGALGLVGVAHAAPVVQATAYLRFTPLVAPPFSTGTNFLDPANGFVPGFAENAGGLKVNIDENLIEYAFQDQFNTDIFDVTSTSLTIKDTSTDGAFPFRFTIFTNKPHFFDNAALTLNELNGLFRVNKEGNGLTFVSPNLIPAGASTRTSTFTFGALPAVPEPLTWAMMVMGFGAVGGMMRRAQSRTRLQLSYAPA